MVFIDAGYGRIDENIERLKRLSRKIEALCVALTVLSGSPYPGFRGKMLELYGEELRKHGVDPLRLKPTVLVDDVGVVCAGRRYEADIVEEEGLIRLVLFKNYADGGALEQIEARRRILEAKGRRVKAYLVANMVEDWVEREAETQNITVIAENIVEVPRE